MKKSPPADQLMKLIVGKWLSKPIYAVAELGIADMLADGARSIDDLARKSRTRAPLLYRVMRGLASIGIFRETEGKIFELTPMAELLTTESMRSIARMFNSPWNDKAWMYLVESLQSGTPAFELAHGQPLFKWLEQNPQAADLLSEANAVKASGSHTAIIDAYNFSDIDRLTDVGGGHGALLCEILLAYPAMRGIVADIPPVLRKTRELIQAHEVNNRCEVVACDFFEEVPKGSDAYLLSNILHDWDDERCRIILQNCRKAMKSESRLLLVEMIIPLENQFSEDKSSEDKSSVAKLLDLEMLVITGGRERTEKEFKELLESVGFELVQIVPTKENIFVIEGTPA